MSQATQPVSIPDSEPTPRVHGLLPADQKKVPLSRCLLCICQKLVITQLILLEPDILLPPARKTVIINAYVSDVSKVTDGPLPVYRPQSGAKPSVNTLKLDVVGGCSKSESCLGHGGGQENRLPK